ncbi:MAG: PAS domain S-box protein [Geobacteraceae bacterium]|nr:PAS domain S-box protein [Geobacteraceae bacterium]NTW81420.1 PAS domain S-box protein [Geobacteraceae bacterium]
MIILSFTIIIILLVVLTLVFRQMNRRLQRQTEFWHNLLECTTAGILIVSSERQIVEVNRRLCEMYGYSRNELVGQSVEILHLDRAQFERFGQWFASARANGPMAQIEYQYRRKDGSTFWAVISGGALVMPDGDTGVIWNLTDISDRKQTEDELAAERSHLKSLFEVNGSGMLVVSSIREILQVNDQFCNLFGYSRDELVGQSARILHVDQQHYEDWAPCFQEAKSGLPLASTDYPWRRKDGTIFWCFFAGVKMQLPNGESGVLWNVIDITERKHAEEELRKSDARMRLFFESPLMGMALSSPGNVWLQVNDKLCQMLGYPREELVSKTWVDLTYPDDLPVELEKFNLLLSGEIDNYSIEKRIIRKDGAIVHTNLSVGCVRRSDGSIDYILGILEDITAYQLLGFKREEDQRFLQTILDSISDFIFYKDKNGIFLGCNEAYTSRYIGLPKERIIGHTDVDFNADGELVKKIIESDHQVMESGSPLLLKNWITQANGQKILVEVLKTPFYDASGDVAGVIGVARDITAHHQVLEAIVQEKEISQRYMDIVGVMLCALNRTGEIILMNKKASQILGYRDNELLGRNWFDVCLPESVRERVKGFFAQQLSGNITPVEFYENTVISRSGEERLIAFHNTLLHDEEGVCGVLFSGEDITEQRRMHDELLKSQKLESLGVLAGGIAHDFNNILSGIMGNISFARMSLATPDKAEKLLENAEKASLRAAMLAARLLTFAKGGEPIRIKMSVGALLEESLLLALRGANVKGEVDIPDDLHAIEADEGQLSQVFNNLIINAVQAMPGGGVLAIKGKNVTLKDHKESLLTQGEYVKLSFSDQGCGISKEDQRKIFDPYFTTKSGGNGLGLASAYSIVKRHGGHIGVSSAIGKGTTFTIYLPSMCEACTEHQTGTDIQSAGDHAGVSILVMDDEAMIREMTSEMLAYLGYQVTTCGDGAEAVSLYEAAMESGAPFSVVIMDLTIPGGMGGKEAAEQILARDPKACLFVSSGYSNDPIMSDYRAFGFSGAVAKPYNINELGQQLSAVLSLQ